MPLDYVREGIQPFVQEMTFPYICSNFFGRMPLPYFLAMRSGQNSKSATTIGRPGMQPILAGVPLSKARMEDLSGSRIFIDIHSGITDNTKEMGDRDTRPVAATAQSDNFAQAEFRRCRAVTPIKCWHSAIKEAMGRGDGSARNADRAVKNVIRKATEEALAVHTTFHAVRMMYGGVVTPTGTPAYSSPVSLPAFALGAGVDYTFAQNTLPWPRYQGVIACMTPDNMYGRVNRANLTAGSAWRGKQVTTAFAPDIFELIDEANIAQGCADSAVGDGGITLGLCTKKQFRRYKRQARKEGHKFWSEGVPEMGEIGFKREVIQVDNCYVTYDPLLPAGYFAGFNLGTWAYAADKKDNWTVTDFKDLTEYTDGGIEADKADLITEASLVCWSPYANCLFTNVQEGN